MSVNTAIILGRVGKEIEVREVGSTVVANFPIATDRQYKGKDGEKKKETCWHNVVAWGKTAEILAQWVKKGDLLYVQGRIDNRSYDDKEGNKRYTSEVVVESFSFIGGGKQEHGGSQKDEADENLPF